MLMPRRRWWVAFAVTAIAHIVALHEIVPTWRILWQISSNCTYTGAAALALARFSGLPVRFDYSRQIAVYAVAACVFPLIIGLVSPPFLRSLFKLESNACTFETLLRATLTNTTGMLLVTPLLLVWTQGGRRFLDL